MRLTPVPELEPSDAEVVREGIALAVSLLARREHGRKELARKLCRKGVDETKVDEIIEALERRGDLSEVRFVETLLHHRVEQGYGPLKMRADLQAKQADPAVFEPMMSALEVDWLSMARAQRQRRFGVELPRSKAECGRQGRFLANRGFPAGLVAKALRGNDE